MSNLNEDTDTKTSMPEPISIHSKDVGNAFVEMGALQRSHPANLASMPLTAAGKRHVLRFSADGDVSTLDITRSGIYQMVDTAARGMTIINKGDTRTGSLRGISRRQSGLADVPIVHMRDIRKLDLVFSLSNEPSISIRKQAIFFNADPTRAIIMRDCCLIFVPEQSDELILQLKESFSIHMKDTNLDFEFRALEVMLSTLCKGISHKYEQVLPVAKTAMEKMISSQMSTMELERLRTIKSSMSEISSQVNTVRRILVNILENEQDLHLLYLTKLHANPCLQTDLWGFNSDDAESLVETYLQEIYGIQSKVILLLTNIENSESLATLKLDAIRNYLLTVDLSFTVLAFFISVPTFITGAFGMNLNSEINDVEYIFWIVYGVCILIPVIGFFSAYRYFKQRGIVLVGHNKLTLD